MIEIFVFSTSSVHSSFTQHAILLNPIAFSCLDHKGVGASDLLEWEEVEVGQLVPGEVEVLPHSGVPVGVTNANFALTRHPHKSCANQRASLYNPHISV